MHELSESQRLRNIAAVASLPTVPNLNSYLAGLDARQNQQPRIPDSVPSLEQNFGHQNPTSREHLGSPSEPNDPCFSRISRFDSSRSFAINPNLTPITNTENSHLTQSDTLSVEQRSQLPWFLSSSSPKTPPRNLKTSTQRPLSGNELLGLDSSDSDSSPIIERRSSVILAQNSQVETQIISDSD